MKGSTVSQDANLVRSPAFAKNQQLLELQRRNRFKLYQHRVRQETRHSYPPLVRFLRQLATRSDAGCPSRHATVHGSEGPCSGRRRNARSLQLTSMSGNRSTPFAFAAMVTSP